MRPMIHRKMPKWAEWLGRSAGYLVIGDVIAIFLLERYGSPAYDVARGAIYPMMISRKQVFVSPASYAIFILATIVGFISVAVVLVAYFTAPTLPRDDPPT
jgi:hypothetical protein